MDWVTYIVQSKHFQKIGLDPTPRKIDSEIAHCPGRACSRCGAVRIFGLGDHISWRCSTLWTLQCRFRSTCYDGVESILAVQNRILA